MKHTTFEMSILRCSNCGKTVMIPRQFGRKRAKGHIKDMWCPYCETESKFVEYREFMKNGLGEEVMV